jgi:hypothetical protein
VIGAQGRSDVVVQGRIVMDLGSRIGDGCVQGRSDVVVQGRIVMDLGSRNW